MKIKNETKVGILATFAIALLIIGYNFLKGNPIFSKATIFYAKYDHVDGLTVSKPVLINGFQIGRVDQLILEPQGYILARLKIDGKYEIPKNTIARLESTDLLGSKAIVFDLGNDRIYAEEGDTLNANVAKRLIETVEPVQKKVEQLINKIDTILTSVNTILNPKFKQNVEKSFTSITSTLGALEATSKKVDALVGNESSKLSKILSNVESITANFKNNETQINSILANFNKVSNHFAAINFKQTIDNANTAIADLHAVINDVKSGKGSLGKLLNDDQMYNNLNKASKNLDALMIDLKANPKRYVHFSVFGGGKKNN